jgi:hypothetical protein
MFSRIAGVVGSFFQIGGPSGPGFVNDSGGIDAKNAAQSALVNVRGADPVLSTDLVTLGYGLIHFGGSGSLAAGTFNVTLPFGADEVFGVVTGLTGAPLKVIATAITEQSVAVQSGIKYWVVAYQLDLLGFHWRLNSSEPWPTSGSVTPTVDYVWSTT